MIERVQDLGGIVSRMAIHGIPITFHPMENDLRRHLLRFEKMLLMRRWFSGDGCCSHIVDNIGSFG